MPKLVISDVAYVLVDERIMIGRSSDNTIVVNDPSISTHHAELLLEGDSYLLRDLGSTNGTLVNGKRVTETILHFEDRIQFGAAAARYQSSEAPESKSLLEVATVTTQLATDAVAPSHFAGASAFRRREQQNDPVRTGILIGLAIVLLAFLGSMIAVLMMHAPAL